MKELGGTDDRGLFAGRRGGRSERSFGTLAKGRLPQELRLAGINGDSRKRIASFESSTLRSSNSKFRVPAARKKAQHFGEPGRTDLNLILQHHCGASSGPRTTQWPLGTGNWQIEGKNAFFRPHLGRMYG